MNRAVVDRGNSPTVYYTEGSALKTTSFSTQCTDDSWSFSIVYSWY